MLEMFCLMLEAHRSPIIIVEGQQIVLNTKLSFLKQLGRKCNPLKLPVLVNRYHFPPISTFRNLCTLYKSKKCKMTCSYYEVCYKNIVKKLKIKAFKIIYIFI